MPTVQEPISVPAPAANKPFLREWRDRLKQLIPLPEPRENPSSGKGRFQPGTFGSPDPLDPSLKLPEIIDVPSDEQLNMPIAEPDLKLVPGKPSASTQIPDAPTSDLAEEMSKTQFQPEDLDFSEFSDSLPDDSSPKTSNSSQILEL
ncbi:MAG: hypothetical protein HC772_05725 [Leptolyngbyaceae cyanobacterium CRU_2_3]|nr:hypothetical protein [Leptolyngbyaceae cyanobacterium CRU_2_3]